MERYICVHAHFYQPPRENPWLEAIELQDSAYPYHDWNQKITAECYAPMGTARILDGSGNIVKIVNNYTRINFNFGPTLLSWMEQKAAHAYGTVLRADKESQADFGGHGSALAQAYNHMIMPLAHPRDKRTQVLWGLKDFETRFGRKPEGMWLPETAVDVESLELLAEAGLKFTILSPHQASRVRKIGGRAWKDISGSRIDPTMAYELNLPSGKKIALYFYDGPISRAIAFEKLLNRGEDLVARLVGAFHDARTWPQMVHVAHVGETYGHHHRYGEMALAYALDSIETNKLARLTNYGEYLEKHPPTHEIEIFENTSWSCAHGVERWKSDCGCNSGLHPGWKQAWRAPLREAFDWLRDTVAPLFEEKGRWFLKDPWAARNDYIEVVLDRSAGKVDQFLSRHAARELNDAEKITVLKLLEIQRQLMLMYTSCGWFFDEISGLETVQVIQYAGRAVQLAQEVFERPLEPEFLDRLEKAKSNLSASANGRIVYERFVKPAAMDLMKVGAHFSISALFQDADKSSNNYCYQVDYEDDERLTAGKARLAMGKMRVASKITWESLPLTFAILHFGDHTINGGVARYGGEEAYHRVVKELTAFFEQADFPGIIRAIDRNFAVSNYSLKTLFRDEQRRIINSILEAAMADVEQEFSQIYENNVPLMRFLADLMVPLPRPLRAAAEVTLNTNLRRAFETEELDLDRVTSLMNEAKEAKITLDAPGLAYALRQHLRKLIDRLRLEPHDLKLLERLGAAVGFTTSLPFEFDFWRIQNIYYEMLQTLYAEFEVKSQNGDDGAKEWVRQFLALGEKLRVKVQ